MSETLTCSWLHDEIVPKPVMLGPVSRCTRISNVFVSFGVGRKTHRGGQQQHVTRQQPRFRCAELADLKQLLFSCAHRHMESHP